MESPPRPAARDAVLTSVASTLAGRGPLVLAVSGGRDSMVLLRAVGAAGLSGAVAAVATFDHGSGATATRAADAVEAATAAAGLHFERGRATEPLRGNEGSWRTARMAFLREVARERNARLVTAHTRDDQRETVAFRILRQSGARGLAGLDADSPVLRPLLGVSRAQLATWATRHAVSWIEDPTNAELRHARNRLRHELLPALEAAHPGFGAWLDDVGERAARWRRVVESLADRIAPPPPTQPEAGEGVPASPADVIAATALADYTPEELSVLWPALLARRGVTVDWRGTERLARFTTTKAVGSRIQLSGRTEVVRVRDGFAVRTMADAGATGEHPLVPLLRFGQWTFRPDGAGVDPWRARLPAARSLTVRSWRDGDRLHQRGTLPRRVARFLAEAGIAGPDRRGWPVVLADDRIVWIPGVRCGDAAGPDEPAMEWSGERTVG